MLPELYVAAESGNWNALKTYQSQLSAETPRKNTVLHILAQFNDSSFIIEQLLAIKPNLLLKLNSQSQSALHIAARNGHFNAVRALINYSKHQTRSRCFSYLLRTRDEDGNLALHEAVRNNFFEIVRLLIVEEDPKFRHGKNNAGESPLYIAAEKGYSDIVKLILFNCTSPSYDGPNGRTALHAATIWNFPEIMQLILEKLPHLTKKIDESGWTPLHFTAKLNRQELAKKLLLVDRTAAYYEASNSWLVEKEERGKTALHVAVSHGHIGVIEELLYHCPDCWETITLYKKHVIHVAVENEQQQVLEFILKKKWASNLINQKDRHGNTPLHLYTFTKNLLAGHFLINHPNVDINAFNDEGFTPLDLLIGIEEAIPRQSFIKSELEKAGGTAGLRKAIYPEINHSKDPQNNKAAQDLERLAGVYLVVSTLIITVTFAAAFTVPGGYNSNNGRPFLAKKTAFIAFIISDFVAMISALSALLDVIIFQRSSTQINRLVALDLSRNAIGHALLAMFVAMVAGLYATLPTLEIRIFLLVVAAWLLCKVMAVLLFWEKFNKPPKVWGWSYRNHSLVFLPHYLWFLYS